MTTAVFILALFGLSFFYLLKFKAVQNFVTRSVKKTKKSDVVVKGEVGEHTVNRILDQLPSKEYRTYSNLYVPSPKNKKRPFSEIDHVVVSRYGIFVIETKNYTGEIEADPTWRNWYYSTTRIAFPNPIKQNKRHVHDLQEYLGLSPSHLHSLVFFIKRNQFKQALPPGVYNRDFLQPIRNQQQPSLGGIQLDQITASLNSLAKPSHKRSAAKKHTAYIASRKANAKRISQ